MKDTFQLNIANRIWGQQGFEFLPAFLDTLADNYGAGLHTLDFIKDAEGARQVINKWVSDQTEEKIQDLIPSGVLDALTRLVLTNAIYFNGKWMLPFDPNNTQDDTFTLLDDTTVQVPLMSQVETINYTKGEGFQAIELPYRGSDMSMVFVLPEKERYEEIEAAFSTDLLDTIIAGFSPHEVDLSLPKYKFESEFNLTDTLIDMGMPDAFYHADFSGMTGKPELFISDILHKAFVAVDEEGTEAAAATAVIMKMSAIMPESLIEVKFDHPFLFLIRDNATGTILFIGRVLNPAGS